MDRRALTSAGLLPCSGKLSLTFVQIFCLEHNGWYILCESESTLYPIWPNGMSASTRLIFRAGPRPAVRFLQCASFRNSSEASRTALQCRKEHATSSEFLLCCFKGAADRARSRRPCQPRQSVSVRVVPCRGLLRHTGYVPVNMVCDNVHGMTRRLSLLRQSSMNTKACSSTSPSAVVEYIPPAPGAAEEHRVEELLELASSRRRVRLARP
jgi:hypothetical protein